MEGIGYWLFLIIIYALSSYLRRKQRKRAAEKKTGEDRPAPQPETPQTDFFRQIFGEIEKEIIPERKDVLLEEEIPIEEELETPELVHKEREPFPVEPAPVEELKTYGIPTVKPETPKDLGGETLSRPEIATKVRSNRLLGSLKTMLKEPDSLRKSIILKEILDKPRALRRSIR